jgi:hypothetical protein
MTERKRVYTPEFKKEAVRLVESTGKPPIQVAREFGISGNKICHAALAYNGPALLYRGPHLLSSLHGYCHIENCWSRTHFSDNLNGFFSSHRVSKNRHNKAQLPQRLLPYP